MLEQGEITFLAAKCPKPESYHSAS